METVQILALVLGIGWASGVNLYAAILTLGIMNTTGHIVLPEELQVLSDPGVLMAAGAMYFIEFFADKIPGVDTGWDAIHTFIRIPAGAILAAGAASGSGVEVSQAAELMAFLVGGSMAATSHLTKASSRVLINTSPEPVTNWTASFAEDIAVVAALWTALNYPWLYVALSIVFVGLVIWLLPKLWRAIGTIFQKIGRWFGNKPSPAPEIKIDAENIENPDILKKLYNDASDKN